MIKRNDIRVKLIGLGVISLVALSIYQNSKYMSLQEKQEMFDKWEQGLLPKQAISRQLKENDIKRRKQEDINNKIQEISDYMNSEEYALREKKHDIEEQTGLDIESIKDVDLKLTFYTSLPSENGGYTVTCNGKPLEGNIVANNTLPQGTKLLINGTVYTVADRGSSRFDNPNRLDVLVERQPGESDSQYLERVNNKGVAHVGGYILEVE